MCKPKPIELKKYYSTNIIYSKIKLFIKKEKKHREHLRVYVRLNYVVVVVKFELGPPTIINRFSTKAEKYVLHIIMLIMYKN